MLATFGIRGMIKNGELDEILIMLKQVWYEIRGLPAIDDIYTEEASHKILNPPNR
jgi:hypothetical protein